MKIITIDFETYYDREFSLSKITTEEYIRDSRFEVIGVGVKINDVRSEWFSGTHQETQDYLSSIDWSDAIAVAHNAMFDAGILSWRFNIRPYMWCDTLSLARAIDGLEVSSSLKSCAERHNLGEKGTEVVNALALRRQDFDPEQLARYGEYCKNDCDLTWDLLNVYLPKVSETELKVIDLTIKMFSEPVLRLAKKRLSHHLEEVKARKYELLQACKADSDILNSNPKLCKRWWLRDWEQNLHLRNPEPSDFLGLPAEDPYQFPSNTMRLTQEDGVGVITSISKTCRAEGIAH